MIQGDPAALAVAKKAELSSNHGSLFALGQVRAGTGASGTVGTWTAQRQ